MAVLVTLATIAMLRGGGEPPLPFFDADLMADMLKDGLEDEDPAILEACLVITESIRKKMIAYRQQVLAGLDAYAANTTSDALDAEALVRDLEPYDRQRTEILHAVVGYRRELVKLLNEEQWTKVFD